MIWDRLLASRLLWNPSSAHNMCRNLHVGTDKAFFRPGVSRVFAQLHFLAFVAGELRMLARYGAAILSMTVALTAGNSVRRYNLPHPLTSLSFVAIAISFCYAMEVKRRGFVRSRQRNGALAVQILNI